MLTPTFAATHNLVAFLEKPTESEGFEQIINFCNAKPIKYVLTVNPTVYTSCIKQFWATTKVKKVNDQEHIQALVDKQKVIITEESIRMDIHFGDAEGTECLLNDAIFKGLARMGYEKLSQSAKTIAWNEFSSTMASAIICLANNQKFNFSKYILVNMVKNLEGDSEEVGVDSDHPTDQIPIVTQPSTSKPHKKQNPRRKQRQETEVSSPTREIPVEEHVPTPSSDPLRSGEDSFQLNELMVFCTSLQTQVLNLEKVKTAQAKEIATLKKRVNKLERRKRSRLAGLRRLRKVGASRGVESSEEKGSLGDQEDPSKQGRSIRDLDVDVEVTLINETQDDLIAAAPKITVAPTNITTAEVVTTVSAPTTTIEELTLAQTLIEIKAAKPKTVTAVSTTATTVTTAVVTIPKTKGVVIQEPSETTAKK
ncbi:hypothetical protein Tco_0231295 [Tanacetum coccineum]